MRLLARGAAVALGTVLAAAPAVAADADDALKQAAQHFADLEDDQAKSILDGLSAQGVAEADVLLGYLYADPLFAGRDYQTAVASFERAAASGNVEAVFQLAESRFWPDYSDWPLTPDEKAARPTAEDAFGLLHRAAADNARTWQSAARWRLAWLCTFGGYDCGDEVTDEAIRQGAWQVGNLRSITSVFWIIGILRSGEAMSDENREMVETYLAIGYAAADPFVAALQSDPVWDDVSVHEDCPDADHIDAAARLMALSNRTAGRFAERLEFQDCYDSEQGTEIERKLGTVLDQAVRTFGYENGWSQKWGYDNREWPAIGDCLIHSVRDHYFVCTKLSMISYFWRRYEIHYSTTARYAQCRAQMLSARGR